MYQGVPGTRSPFTWYPYTWHQVLCSTWFRVLQFSSSQVPPSKYLRGYRTLLPTMEHTSVYQCIMVALEGQQLPITSSPGAYICAVICYIRIRVPYVKINTRFIGRHPNAGEVRTRTYFQDWIPFFCDQGCTRTIGAQVCFVNTTISARWYDMAEGFGCLLQTNNFLLA